MKDDVMVRFPDGSQQDCLLSLTDTELLLGEVSLRLADIVRCTRQDAAVTLSDGENTYEITFSQEEKAQQFANILGILEEDMSPVSETAPETEEPSDKAPEAAEAAEEEEEKTPKKKSTGKIIAIILAVVVVLAAAGVGIYFWLSNRLVTAYGENTVTAQADYCRDEIPEKELDYVVAVDAEGNALLTNREAQIYYWSGFYSFMNYYGNYAAYMGLNPTLPLATQPAPEEGLTWEQFFMQDTFENYGRYHALMMAARAEGFTLSAEDQEILDDLMDPAGKFVENVTSGGYVSVDAYLKDSFGPYTTLETYHSYMVDYITAMSYYDKCIFTAASDAIGEAQVLAYADAHPEDFQDIRMNNVSVRHILLSPEGEPDPETKEFSQEAWDAAQAKAQEILDQWKADPTVESFTALAKEHTMDPGSKENGGLYEDFAPGAMVKEFNDWCFDPARKPGDVDIVKTPYGYHIIYFLEQTDTRAWFDAAKDQLLREETTKRMEELTEQYPVEVDYALLRLYDMIIPAPAPLPETPEVNPVPPAEG